MLSECVKRVWNVYAYVAHKHTCMHIDYMLSGMYASTVPCVLYYVSPVGMCYVKLQGAADQVVCGSSVV